MKSFQCNCCILIVNTWCSETWGRPWLFSQRTSVCVPKVGWAAHPSQAGFEKAAGRQWLPSSSRTDEALAREAWNETVQDRGCGSEAGDSVSRRLPHSQHWFRLVMSATPTDSLNNTLGLYSSFISLSLSLSQSVPRHNLCSPIPLLYSLGGRAAPTSSSLDILRLLFSCWFFGSSGGRLHTNS